MNLLTSTGDGSNTLFNEKIGENYHSKHGALQESKHVFIEAGLKATIENKKELHIFEVGFGTGLNFLLSLDECIQKNIQLHYTALEPFPLSVADLQPLNYRQYISDNIWSEFIHLYDPEKSSSIQFSDGSTLELYIETLEKFAPKKQFDLIYFDAFSVRHQPELWSDEIILKTCEMLKSGGIFVTYAITGKLKRAVVAAGCSLEKLTGAPGKREMLRATKI